MGSIANYKYETDAGSIFKVRMDGDAVLDSIRGTAPQGNYTEEMHVQVSKNDKEVGIRPRYVLFGREISGSGNLNCLLNTGTRYKKVVILTQSQLGTITTGQPNGAGVTNFQQNGATYWALETVKEKVQ